MAGNEIQDFSFTSKVNFNQVDSAGKLKPAAAATLFEGALSTLVSRLGFDRAWEDNNHRAWVVSRLSFALERRFRFGDAVTVRAWMQAIDRVFVIMNFEILDGEEVFGRGSSSWILINADTREPLMARNSPIVPSPHSDAAPATPLLHADAALTPAGERRAAYSDIDLNGHVHNTRYLDWFCDLLDVNALCNAETFSLEINFLKEVLPGVNVAFFMAAEPAGGSATTYTLEGRADGAPAFRARLRLSYLQGAGYPVLRG
jgi:acyl-ACP thioesterase